MVQFSSIRSEIHLTVLAALLAGATLMTVPGRALAVEPELSIRYLSGLRHCSSGEGARIVRSGRDSVLHAVVRRVMESDTATYPYADGDVANDTLRVWKQDLDGDGRPEAVVFPSWRFRGAQGNGDIFVLRQGRGRDRGIWAFIGRLEGNSIYLEKARHGGYSNLITYWHMSSCSGQVTRYGFDRKAGRYTKVAEAACSQGSAE